jgi:hypothetical protein
MKIRQLLSKKPKKRNKRRSGGKKNPFFADNEAMPAPQVSASLKDLAGPKAATYKTAF